MSFYAQKTYFKCIEQLSLHSPNSQDSPNSTNLPNLHNTCQTRLREYPIFVILAKTCLAQVTTSTRNAPQMRLRVLARVLTTLAKLSLAKFAPQLALLNWDPFQNIFKTP